MRLPRNWRQFAKGNELEKTIRDNLKGIGMGSDLVINKDYKVWLADIKLKVRNAQIKAALKVNTELLTLYWELGADIVAKQAAAKWEKAFFFNSVRI